jgi:DNA-binding transcriptional MerR regulator
MTETKATQPVAVCQERAAAMLGVTARTLQNWRRQGIITGNRAAGGKVLFAVEELRRVAAGRTAKL